MYVQTTAGAYRNRLCSEAMRPFWTIFRHFYSCFNLFGDDAAARLVYISLTARAGKKQTWESGTVA